MENGTYEQIVTHLEKELDSLEYLDETQMNTVTPPQLKKMNNQVHSETGANQQIE